MIRMLCTILALLALAVAWPAHAAVRILATTADWGSLATELGGDKVNVYVATSALQDVHRRRRCQRMVRRHGVSRPVHGAAAWGGDPGQLL